MKFLNSIPRGLAIFICGIIIVIALVWGYVAFFGNQGNSSSSGSGATNFFSSLFPFGNPSAPAQNGGASSNTDTSASSTQAGSVPLLRHVSNGITSGAWFVEGTSTTSPPAIRYMDRESGHITETPADSFEGARISNTTIPGIEELYDVTPSSVILRSLTDGGDVQNFFGVINATSSEQSINITPLPPFDRVSVDAAGKNILTVAQVNGGSQVTLSNPDGTSPKTLFASVITSWVPLTEAGRVFLETAPTAAAPGYLYEVKSGILSKIVGGLSGLTAIISPSGRYVAYSADAASGFAFAVLDTQTNQTFTSPIGAFAMKCAWVPNHEPLLFCAVPTNPATGAYPDDWLMGTRSFSDDAWILDPSRSTAYFIGTLVDENGNALDTENPVVDANGSYALFMNKNDLSLWSLKIGDIVARVLSL